jgi:hypothetical protein
VNWKEVSEWLSGVTTVAIATHRLAQVQAIRGALLMAGITPPMVTGIVIGALTARMTYLKVKEWHEDRQLDRQSTNGG